MSKNVFLTAPISKIQMVLDIKFMEDSQLFTRVDVTGQQLIKNNNQICANIPKKIRDSGSPGSGILEILGIIHFLVGS